MIDSRVAERARARSIPWSAYAELTYACNWRCVFCYNPRHRDIRRLTFDQWTRVLDSLRRLGTLNLTITGGEPLASPDFFDIARAARERAFALRIFTNGALVDDSAAERIASYDPLAVELSLHGATSAVHDAVTATRGSFESMWSGVGRLLERGVRVVLKTPVTSLNEHELDGIVHLCEERHVPLRLDVNITPRDDGDLSPLRYTASAGARRRVMQIAVQDGSIRFMNRKEGEENCGVGKVNVVIDPEGNVYPCMQWRHRALGNVRDNDLDWIWATSQERQQAIRTSLEANDAMRDLGTAADALPFCPALAMQSTGSAVTPDEAYLRNAAVARELLSGS